MTPTDPNPAREADGRADREVLAALLYRLEWDADLYATPRGPETERYERRADHLIANRAAVLRALLPGAYWERDEYKARAEAAEEQLRISGVVERLADQVNMVGHWRSRAEAAERKVARVERLLDNHKGSHHPTCLQERGIAGCNCVVADVRAALAGEE